MKVSRQPRPITILTIYLFERTRRKLNGGIRGDTDYWQVCTTDYEHSISLADYATYEDAKAFRDKLAEFIDENVSRQVEANHENH